MLPLMSEQRSSEFARAALQAWLQSDARLGISHWAVSPTLTAQPGADADTSIDAGARVASRTPTAQAASGAIISSRAAGAPSAGARIPAHTAGPAAIPAAPSIELPAADAARELATLDEQLVRGCVRCGLHAQRTQTVFGVGDPRAALVFVGEGPGADEDLQGKPFVGRAGQLLTRMIAAMSLTREQVYICNVVKCRPPGNRTPTDDEMATCSQFLFRQLALIRPRVIVALGRPATQTLLASRAPISALRGRFHDFPPPALADHGLPPARLMPTFHPAYLLRSPGEKGKAWDDLKQVMAFLGIPVPP